MQVAKWGNSLAIRIPAAVVKILNLKEGDNVDVTRTASGALAIDRRPDRAELIDRLCGMAVQLPDDWKMTRDEMNARGPDSE